MSSRVVIPATDTAAANRFAASSAGRLAAIERDVMATITYADLFDYPLTEPEVHRYLAGAAADQSAVAVAIDRLTGDHLERCGEYICLSGRQHTVETRLARLRASAPRWAVARQYAAALRRYPFVRMVAVCGSLAVDNTDGDGDIDIFCIAAPGRLWWVQVAAMLLRRLPRFARQRVCPNFFLSQASLSLEERDLYTAHEIVQSVPLAGEAVYDEFVAANTWLDELLPNARAAENRPRAGLGDRADADSRASARAETDVSDGATEPYCSSQSRLAAGIERLFGGRIGGAIDRAAYSTLLRYYALRLRPRGVTLQQLRHTYRRDRQLVVGGGYRSIVRTRLAARLAAVVGERNALAAVERLFPGGSVSAGAEPAHSERPPQLYEQQFETRYGVDR